jgi:hypothetical protein
MIENWDAYSAEKHEAAAERHKAAGLEVSQFHAWVDLADDNERRWIRALAPDWQGTIFELYETVQLLQVTGEVLA